jgi:hypothetical protein
MGFFSFRREQVTDDDLRDALFAAAAASAIRALKKLASRHLERVVQLFPTWKTLPPDVLSDPTRYLAPRTTGPATGTRPGSSR